MTTISPAVLPILMLFASNVFMTFAWYGHLKFRESWLPAVVLVEFIVDESGRPFTYDINTNTNYNSEAEAKDGRHGMGEIARYLGRLLAEYISRAASFKLTICPEPTGHSTVRLSP